jgi:hypothetical protein
VKPLECKGHVGAECRLAYCPGATLAQISESRLPRNGEVIDIVFLDDLKKCDQVIFWFAVGVSRCGGGVAGKRSS